MSVCDFYSNCVYNRKCEANKYCVHDPHKQKAVTRSIHKKKDSNFKKRFGPNSKKKKRKFRFS